MKKYLSMIALSSTLVLTGCGKEEEPEVEDPTEDVADEEVAEGLQDGTYEIKDSEADDNGYLEGLTIVVSGGEITDATWDSVDEDGNPKIEDEDYQETMTQTDGIGPQEFIPELENQLLDTQNPEDMDVVTGATGTFEKFQAYAKELLEAAEEGNTDVIEK